MTVLVTWQTSLGVKRTHHFPVMALLCSRIRFRELSSGKSAVVAVSACGGGCRGVCSQDALLGRSTERMGVAVGLASNSLPLLSCPLLSIILRHHVIFVNMWHQNDTFMII